MGRDIAGHSLTHLVKMRMKKINKSSDYKGLSPVLAKVELNKYCVSVKYQAFIEFLHFRHYEAISADGVMVMCWTPRR